MIYKNHIALLLGNDFDKAGWIKDFLAGRIDAAFDFPVNKKGVLFSEQALQDVLQEEHLHDRIIVAKGLGRKLNSFSSGERKKLFLHYCLNLKLDYLILDNPYDHLDTHSRKSFNEKFICVSQKISLVQLAHRREDILGFIGVRFTFDSSNKSFIPLLDSNSFEENPIALTLPSSFGLNNENTTELVRLESVSISFGSNEVLKNIDWTIKQNEFWQLVGPNGSGKSSLLSLITGDSIKGYGQEVYLFGQKKGSGESIWDIKSKIGCFSTTLLDLFKSGHAVEEMLFSGFYDPIGLYDTSSDAQRKMARQWLKVVDMDVKKSTRFHRLTEGEQRLILIIRAVIKNPPLLLLDEPLEGMDDNNLKKLVFLINTLVNTTNMTVILVSHWLAAGLATSSIFELYPEQGAYTGLVLK